LRLRSTSVNSFRSSATPSAVVEIGVDKGSDAYGSRIRTSTAEAESLWSSYEIALRALRISSVFLDTFLRLLRCLRFLSFRISLLRRGCFVHSRWAAGINRFSCACLFSLSCRCCLRARARVKCTGARPVQCFNRLMLANPPTF